VTSSPLALTLAAIVISRLIEMNVAEVNTGRMRMEGWREVGAKHYPLFILLHGSLIIATALTTPLTKAPIWPLIWALAVLQAARFWAMISLGRQWTTRIMTRDDAPLNRRGPYRYMRHPAYAVASLEVAVLPLAFGDWIIALAWSGLNALLVLHRIRLEEAALAPRRMRA
jgi:methyltransferase